MELRESVLKGVCTGTDKQIDLRHSAPPAVEVAIVVIWRRAAPSPARQADFSPHAPPARDSGPAIETLLTRRPHDAHLGSLWEYPGGKIEPGESAEDAARREAREETGLVLVALEPLITVEHAYAHRIVRLHAFLAEAPERAAIEPEGVAGWRWAWVDELPHIAMPAANAPITATAVKALEKKVSDTFMER